MRKFTMADAPRILAERSRVDAATGCIEMQRHLNHDGYGRFKFAGKRIMAHRLAWLVHFGPVPDGFELDHKCKNRACINTAHLEVVTHAENVRRGLAAVVSAQPRLMCKKRLHMMTDDNIIWRHGGADSRLCRMCLICYRATQKKRLERKTPEQRAKECAATMKRYWRLKAEQQREQA